MDTQIAEVETWWNALEGGAAGDADDARHWVRVYDELIAALERIRSDFESEPEGYQRVRRRLSEARRRRMHWLARVS